MQSSVKQQEQKKLQIEQCQNLVSGSGTKVPSSCSGGHEIESRGCMGENVSVGLHGQFSCPNSVIRTVSLK